MSAPPWFANIVATAILDRARHYVPVTDRHEVAVAIWERLTALDVAPPTDTPARYAAPSPPIRPRDKHPAVAAIVEHEAETRRGTHPGRAYKPG